MGRTLRSTDDLLTYHAINRGNDRRVVLADDEDHLAFLKSLARTQLRCPFRLQGYCLMSDAELVSIHFIGARSDKMREQKRGQERMALPQAEKQDWHKGYDETLRPRKIMP